LPLLLSGYLGIMQFALQWAQDACVGILTGLWLELIRSAMTGTAGTRYLVLNADDLRQYC